MPVIKYRVILTDKERNKLIKIITKGSVSAKMIMHANVLLAADEESIKKQSENEIANMYRINPQTVHTIRKSYATQGLDAALGRKKRKNPPIQPKIAGDVEAKIIALSCNEPPKGRSKWTLRLLADKVIELQIVENITHESVCRLLKNELKPHLHKCWVIPPHQNAAFVACANTAPISRDNTPNTITRLNFTENTRRKNDRFFKLCSPFRIYRSKPYLYYLN